MKRGVIIDGNNLLFAVQAHAPVKALGREALVRRIELWAKNSPGEVVIAFDGAAPKAGLLDQLTPARLDVRFSAPRTADDLITDLIHQLSDPGSVEVISDDKAILYEARFRGCRTLGAVEFVELLFPSRGATPRPSPEESTKPERLSPEEQQFWREEFNVAYDDEPPFDGIDSMKF